MRIEKNVLQIEKSLYKDIISFEGIFKFVNYINVIKVLLGCLVLRER